MSFSKSVNLEHAQRAVPCNICEDEVPGEYYCIECKQTLCPQCEKNHKRVAATKNHNIVLRTQIGNIDTTILTCGDHGEPASCHCEKCNIPVCIKCVTGKHKGHVMSDLADILKKKKKILQNDVNVMQRELSSLKNQQQKICTEREKYKKEIQKILTDMEDENQAVIREIQRKHKERMDGITSTQDSHLAVFDSFENKTKTKIISYQERISEYEDMMATNSLSALSKVKVLLPENRNKLELPDPPSFVPANLQVIVQNLGSLHISSSSPSTKSVVLKEPTNVSNFRSPLKGSSCICITKEGDIWVGGWESRKLVMVDIKGQVLRKRKIKNRPASLTVMDCGDVIISPRKDDSSSVSRLLKNDREQQVYDTSPSCSTGVSVTADQNILICSVDGRVIRVNGDGTNAKQIYKGSSDYTAIHAVERYDGNIYISDKANRALVMISKDGTILARITHTTEGQQFGELWGLEVDKMGNILCADRTNNCIYIKDQDQQMRQLVGQSQGIQHPRRLAVDNDNTLWIAQYGETVNVVKYV